MTCRWCGTNLAPRLAVTGGGFTLLHCIECEQVTDEQCFFTTYAKHHLILIAKERRMFDVHTGDTYAAVIEKLMIARPLTVLPVIDAEIAPVLPTSTDDYGDDIPQKLLPAPHRLIRGWRWTSFELGAEKLVMARYVYKGVIVRGVILERNAEWRASVEGSRTKPPEFGQGATLAGTKRVVGRAMLRLAWRAARSA